MRLIHVIIGPPCAGKSTYVREHAAAGDVRVDFDELATALGSDSPHDAPDEIKSAAFAARTAVIDRALSGQANADYWVIHTSPSDEQMAAYEEAGADITTLDPGIDECLRRASDDGRPARTEQVIRDWYSGNKGATLHKTKDFSINLKSDSADDSGEWTFDGYAATFDREPDSYGDVIAKGAFTDTLKDYEDAGRRIPLLFGHNMSDPDYNLGYVDAAEDDRGLHVTGHIYSDTPKGETVYKLLKRGQVSKMSFAYDVAESGQVTLEDGTKANELRKLDLFECSVVTVPANIHAEIEQVKAMQGKQGRRNSKADEDLLKEMREDAQAIIDAIDTLTGAVDDSGEPADEPADGEGASAPEGQDAGGKAEFFEAYRQAIIETL